jgi:N-methylhydantoinase B
MIESEYPIRIEQYGLVTDSAGPGRNRGGLSLMRAYRILCPEVVLNVRSDKRRFPPHGLFGGKPGRPAESVVNPDTARERLLPILMMHSEELKEGDVFRHIMAGGGGYGDPLERNPEMVLRDVIEEKVTPRHAREAYGVVVVDAKPLPRLDRSATAELRKKMRAGQASLEMSDRTA